MRIVDRRLNPGGKSFSNRQRFLRRVRETVERAVREASRERAIEELEKSHEVSVPLGGAREPLFRHTPGDRRDYVLPGNRDYVEGDLIDRPTGESGGGGTEPGRGGGQEDAFKFVLTREEFLSIFLDDLELPDFIKRGLVDTQKLGSRRAGYTTSGTPANLALGRTMQISLARRIAMRRPRRHMMERLEEQAAGAEAADEATAERFEEELRNAQARLLRIPYLDPADLRYRRFERFPKPVAQAVMFCLMDVSASMDERKKDLAKRFFALLHLFLSRKYERLEIVFVRHTDDAEEVDEQRFFHDRKTGGTVVLSALALMHRIIEERYPLDAWNIYGAQASDGDAFGADPEKSRGFLETALMPLVRHYAYIEVCEAGSRVSTLSAAYRRIANEAFAMREVHESRDIWPVFRGLFGKQQPSVAALER